MGKSVGWKFVTTGVTTDQRNPTTLDHLEQALHHLARANENELAKQLKLRIIELTEAAEA